MVTVSSRNGFSLAELLITVAIVGVVAAFTVPKVLDSTNSSTSLSAKQTAMAREAAFMILSAYEQYKAVNGTIPESLRASDLTPYMNYAAVLPASTQLDAHANTGGTISTCNATNNTSQDGVCLSLHNGAALWADTLNRFAAPNSLNNRSVVYFRFDPNARYDGGNDGPGMAMQIALYPDGVIRSRANLRSNSTYVAVICVACSQTENSAGNEDPNWFTGF